MSKAVESLHEQVLTHYERARLIGARALQLGMGAPPLVKTPEGLVSSVKLAFLEFEKNVVPLKVVVE